MRQGQIFHRIGRLNLVPMASAIDRKGDHPRPAGHLGNFGLKHHHLDNFLRMLCLLYFPVNSDWGSCRSVFSTYQYPTPASISELRERKSSENTKNVDTLRIERRMLTTSTGRFGGQDRPPHGSTQYWADAARAYDYVDGAPFATVQLPLLKIRALTFWNPFIILSSHTVSSV